MSRRSFTRRQVVGFAGAAGSIVTAGCLRLTGDQTATPSGGGAGTTRDDEPVTSSQDGETTSTEQQTTTAPEDITLTEAWTSEELWGVFGHDDLIAGEGPSREGGYIVFAEPDGSVAYESESIGGDYMLQLKQGDALASNGATVFGGGRDVSGDVETARVAAFDGDTGARQWTHETEASGTESRIPSLVADDDTVYYATVGEGSARDQRAVVRAVDAGSGTVEWEHVVGEDFLRGVAKHGSRLFVGRSQQLLLLDAATGNVESRVDLGTSAFRGMVRSGDRLFVTDSRIRAYDLETGEELWAVERDREPDSPISVVGNALYAGTDAGYVTAHDLDDGAKLWETRTAQSIVTKPAVNDRTVFVGDSAGNVSGIDRASGEVVYEGQHSVERPERTTLAAVGSVACISGLGTDSQVTRGFEIG